MQHNTYTLNIITIIFIYIFPFLKAKRQAGGCATTGCPATVCIANSCEYLDGDKCVTDLDCQGNPRGYTVCRNNECQPPTTSECDNNVQCGAGFVCNYNSECVPAASVQCQTNAQCATVIVLILFLFFYFIVLYFS